MRRIRGASAAAAALSVLCFGACSSAQPGSSAGKPPEAKNAVPAPPAPPPQDAAAAEVNRGREEAARLFSRDPLIGDERLLRYVNLVGRAAVADARGRDRFRFAVTQSGIPYSRALPGGFVILSRGALALMDSEAELAVALAREVCREESVGAAADSPEPATGGGDPALEARWDACGARLASSSGYDAAAYLHYLDALELGAASARERMDLERRAELYRKLPECSRGGKTLVERFRRSAMS